MFGAGMMQQMLKALKPHLNKIGESLVTLQGERSISAPADVRIVISASVDARGKVHTIMQHVESAPTPTADLPNLRVINTLMDEQGKPMMYGIEQLAGLLGTGE